MALQSIDRHSESKRNISSYRQIVTLRARFFYGELGLPLAACSCIKLQTLWSFVEVFFWNLNRGLGVVSTFCITSRLFLETVIIKMFFFRAHNAWPHFTTHTHKYGRNTRKAFEHMLIICIFPTGSRFRSYSVISAASRACDETSLSVVAKMSLTY